MILFVIFLVAQVTEATEPIGFADIALSRNGHIHIGFNTGYLILDDKGMLLTDVNPEIHADWIKIGSDNNAYVYGEYPESDPTTPAVATRKMKKVDVNGNLMSDPEIVSYNSTWAIKDDNGNNIFIMDNGVVDSNNNLHLFGEYNSYNFTWQKISADGTVLAWKSLNESVSLRYVEIRVGLDSEDNIHLTFLLEGGLYYMKLNTDGDVLVDILEIEGIEYAMDNKWSMGIDSENNIHILYFHFLGKTINYVKLNSTGDMVISPKEIQACYPDNLELDVGPENNIHVVYTDSSVYYMKLDSDGNILDEPIDVIKASKDNTVLYLGITGIIIAVVAIGGYAWHRKNRSSK